MEAERVVVELIAKVDSFDGKVVQSATKFDSSMKQIETSAARAEDAVARSSGNRASAIQREGDKIAQVSRMLGGQVSDLGSLMSGPKSPFVVPVKQAPAVSKAFQLIQLGAATAGGVLGGILLSATIEAATALAGYVLQGDKFNSMVAEMLEKLKEDAQKTEAARRAKDLYANSLEGVTEAIRIQKGAIDELTRANEGAAERAAKDTLLSLVRIERIQTETQALVDNARAMLEYQRARASGAGQGAELAALNLPDRQRALGDLEARLKAVNTQVGQARSNFREAFSLAVVERAEQLADPLAKIKKRYDDLVEAARKAATGDELRNGALKRQVDLLRAAQKAEEDRYRASQRKPRSAAGDAGLPKVTEAEVAGALGLSAGQYGGRRSAARNREVKGAANSYHLSGQAIDIPLTVNGKPMTKAGIRAALAPLGVEIKELLGPGDKGHNDHFHIAFSKRRLGPDQVSDRANRDAAAAERAADAEERRRQGYENELASLQSQEIDARQSLVASAEQIAAFETQAIELARTKYNDNLASLVETGKLQADEAVELQKLNDERAKLRTELVKRREDERKFRLQEADAKRRLDLAVGQQGIEAELLQSRQGLAKTAKERHALEGRLIELQFNEERLQLQAVVASAQRLEIELARIETLRALSDEEKAALQRARDEATLAQGRLATQGERQANAQAGNDQANASPLQAFFGGIPTTADEINEALESVAAGGLATFTDALTDAIVNFKSLGDVGRQVLASITAQLVRMAIQQVILHTIGKTLGMTATAATTAQASAAAAAWAPAAAAASLATLGANAGPAAAALASTHALSAALSVPKGFKSGGYTGSGAVDAPAGIVHGKEFVFDAEATRRIGPANLEAMRRGVRPSNAAAISPGGGGAGVGGDFASSLRSIVTEAIQAMPDVNLFPTIDPAEVFERALASPRGQKALIAHLSDNRGSVSGALQQ